MPEGDTIHRAARALSRAVGGQILEAFESPLSELHDAVAKGTRIERIDARGKHLLVRFEDGRILDTHMRMEGSWHLYRPGEAWQRARDAARVVLRTEQWVVVCFDAPWVKLLRDERSLDRLGPDLLADGFDAAQASSRIQAMPALAIGEALLRQDLVSGIGNVYKSEVLFLARSDPFALVRDLSISVLQDILQRATSLMRANLTGRERTTRYRLSGARLWVYRRQGQPCFECGGVVRMRRQGETQRSTYYCPRCQPPR